MNFYEECLTLGQFLSQQERLALYKYLLTAKKSEYSGQIKKLLQVSSLRTSIANGEIEYRIIGNFVSYSSRKLDSSDFGSSVRKMKIGRIPLVRVWKLRKFLAQAEVDVLSNFPLPGINQDKDRSFTFNTIPYYDLNHFSNGRGKLLGLTKRINFVDKEILTKLRTL